MGSDELSLEIKDDLNVIVRDGSLTPYLENSSNNEEHYIVNDLALEFGKKYQYRIYGDFTYYESSFTYYPKPNLGVLAAVPREVMYGHVVDFVVTGTIEPDGVVMNHHFIILQQIQIIISSMLQHQAIQHTRLIKVFKKFTCL